METSKLSDKQEYSLKKANSKTGISREDIMKNYKEDTVNQSWEAFSNTIEKNYCQGRGTLIPTFGVFSFMCSDVNLKGTTNERERDLRSREPVFIMSKSFLDFIKPGIFINGNLLPYTQTLNENICHTKISYAEIAISVGIAKHEVEIIIQNCLRFISDSIIRQQFKNKELNGIGALICKSGLLGVKFNQTLISKIKELPQRLAETKKAVSFYMEPIMKRTAEGTNKHRFSNSLSELRPKTAYLLSKITPEAEKWLKQNLDVNIEDIINNQMKDKNFDASKFLNDLNIKMKERKKSLFEMNLSNKTLENIYYMRNDLLSKLRAYDINYSKRLKLVNIVDIFYKLNIEGLTKEIIQNLIKCYCSSIDDIDYLSFMDRLILDIQNIMQYEIKQLKNEKTFRNSHSYKEINSLKATCKLELEVKDKSSDLNEIKREIKIIKYVFPQILQKNRAKQEQLITYRELMPSLKEFNIKYPVEKIIKLLKFLDLDPDKFSLNSMNTNLIGFNIINLACKIINNEIFTDDILNGIFSIKDAIFLSEKTPDELFSYYGSNKIIYRENFVKLIKTLNDNLTEVLIDAIFTYLTKMERPLSIEDFTTAFAPKNIDENFELSAIKRINDKLRQMHYNVEEYFDHLLSTKLNSTEKKLSKPEFYKAIKQDNYNFSSQEIVQLFKIFDKKCDNFVDREEFSEKIKSIYDPLFLIQDFIKKYKLDIEDVLIRMQIDKNKNCELDYTLFKMSLY